MRIDTEFLFYISNTYRKGRILFLASIVDEGKDERMNMWADMPSIVPLLECDACHPKRINFRIFTGATSENFYHFPLGLNLEAHSLKWFRQPFATSKGNKASK